MIKNIAVYSSSSDALDKKFVEITAELGKLMAKNNMDLVWGGAHVGLMGTIADSVKNNGGKVYGYLPNALRDKGIAYENADELVFTNDLRDRKAMMADKADALIALPGGFGTLEEALEMLTLKQLKYHDKPIIFLDVDHFFDPLVDMFEKMYEIKVAKPEYRELYYITNNPQEAIDYLQNYTPPQLPDKWFKKEMSEATP